MISSSTLSQFLRYAVVGLLSNLFLYFLYIAFTTMGLAPKLAMSTLYALGVAQTFIFNKRWAFSHKGMHGQALVRYGMAYGIGYIINLLALFALVDHLGYPHQIVQAALLIAIAILLFLLQKFWVFRTVTAPLPPELVKP